MDGGNAMQGCAFSVFTVLIRGGDCREISTMCPDYWNTCYTTIMILIVDIVSNRCLCESSLRRCISNKCTHILGVSSLLPQTELHDGVPIDQVHLQVDTQQLMISADLLELLPIPHPV